METRYVETSGLFVYKNYTISLAILEQKLIPAIEAIVLAYNMYYSPLSFGF